MNEVPTIHIDDYPELAMLAWNRVVREVAEDEALALYEANWRFVDAEHLLPVERALIDRLANQYGHGVLNV